MVLNVVEVRNGAVLSFCATKKIYCVEMHHERAMGRSGLSSVRYELEGFQGQSCQAVSTYRIDRRGCGGTKFCGRNDQAALALPAPSGLRLRFCDETARTFAQDDEI